MKNDEIIRMAREAGFSADMVNHDTTLYSGVEEALERFAALVAVHEREACANVCEDHFSSDGHWCAAAIRARSEK